MKNFTISNLIPLVCLFGSNAIKEIAFKYGYGCLIPDEMQKERIAWREICKIQDKQAFDLLDKMLELDDGSDDEAYYVPNSSSLTAPATQQAQ